MDEDSIEDYINKANENDMANINEAMNSLIDNVSRFKSIQSLEELTVEDFAEMLTSLEFGHFIISGVMYSNGLTIGRHEHDEEEEDED